MTQPEPATPAIQIADSACRRITAMMAAEGGDDVLFRISVTGGGCSGFQYHFDFDHHVSDDDLVFERDGVRVVVDEVSLELVEGSEIAYVEDLIGSYFQMNNPNATASCGCGTSFSI